MINKQTHKNEKPMPEKTHDLNLEELLTNCIKDLQTKHPEVHTLLTKKIEERFFEESQGGKAFEDLADHILQAIAQPEEENANKSN